jgi:predicted nucleic acid-binding protein
MRMLLDTNRYRDLCVGLPEVVERVRLAERVSLPFVTLAELRAGFLCGTRARRNETVLARFLNRPGVSVLFPDEDTTRHYAQIYRQLRQQGTPIPTNDIWIAALTEQHNLLLYSRDRHFDALPQLPRLD